MSQLGLQLFTDIAKFGKLANRRNIQFFVTATTRPLVFKIYRWRILWAGSVVLTNHVTYCDPRSGFSTYYLTHTLSAIRGRTEQLCGSVWTMGTFTSTGYSFILTMDWVNFMHLSSWFNFFIDSNLVWIISWI